MSLPEIEAAKRESTGARARLEATLAALQERLTPSSLAEEAWDGVKEKSADLADGAVQAVKSRPKTVSLALGALAIFLARAPLKRAVTRLISGEEDADGNQNDDAELSVSEGVS